MVIRVHWRSQGLNFGGGATFLWHFECEHQRRKQWVRGHAPRENFEFLDSLERYFTYFRTWFGEKLQAQNSIFKSPNVVRLKKYLCKYTQIQQQNSTMPSFL